MLIHLTKSLLTGLLVFCYLVTTIAPIRAEQIFIPSIGNNPNLVLLYSDDFSDPGSGWTTSSNEVHSHGYVDDEFEILIKRSITVAVTRGGPRFANYSFRADTRLVTASEAGRAYGLVFGYVNSSDFLMFFVDSNDKTFSVQRWIGNQVEIIDDWQAISGDFQAAPAANSLRVDHNEENYTIYINGSEVASGTVVQPTGDVEIGLIAGAGTDLPAAIRFDNVEVYALPN